jgi:hypothetical protein
VEMWGGGRERFCVLQRGTRRLIQGDAGWMSVWGSVVSRKDSVEDTLRSQAGNTDRHEEARGLACVRGGPQGISWSDGQGECWGRQKGSDVRFARSMAGEGMQRWRPLLADSFAVAGRGLGLSALSIRSICMPGSCCWPQ